MIENRKAFFDYEIVETYECGMCLQGWEVKAIAGNVASIAGSHCKILNSEAFLIGSNIGTADRDQQRTRKLLLLKKEITRLIGKTQERGLTLVPLKLYTKNGKYKLEIGLAKGKKLHDKRETEKMRDIDNENRRIVKSQKFE
jgi:SsrA-binding protein